MFGPIHHVVFDLDGTLVSTMSAVIQGLSEAVALGRGETISTEELVMSFGPAPLDVLRKWMPEERVAVAYDHWLRYEKTTSLETLPPFEGVPELLKTLQEQKISLGIFTGRDREGTLRILRHLGWLDVYFAEKALACGDDGRAPKPHPDSLRYLIQTLNFDPAYTLMVGDHPYDVQAGRAAGTKTAAALWDRTLLGGKQYSERSQFQKAWKRWDGVPCDLRLESPESLTRWFQNGLK